MKRVGMIIGIVVLAMALATPAFCQQQQGTKEIGFNVSLQQQTTSYSVEGYTFGENTLGLSGQVLFGYFLTNHLEVGASIFTGINNSKDKDDTYEDNAAIFAPGLLVRYIFGSGKLRPFVGFAPTLYTMSSKSTSTDYDGNKTSSTTSASGFEAVIPIGLKYFLTEKTALNLELDPFFGSLKYKSGDFTATESSSGFNLLFGFSVFF